MKGIHFIIVIAASFYLFGTDLLFSAPDNPKTKPPTEEREGSTYYDNLEDFLNAHYWDIRRVSGSFFRTKFEISPAIADELIEKTVNKFIDWVGAQLEKFPNQKVFFNAGKIFSISFQVYFSDVIRIGPTRRAAELNNTSFDDNPFLQAITGSQSEAPLLYMDFVDFIEELKLSHLEPELKHQIGVLQKVIGLERGHLIMEYIKTERLFKKKDLEFHQKVFLMLIGFTKEDLTKLLGLEYFEEEDRAVIDNLYKRATNRFRTWMRSIGALDNPIIDELRQAACKDKRKNGES